MADPQKDSGPSSSTSSSGGILRWIWRGIVGVLFGRRNVDFEKRLQHLSKEEVSVHTRMKRRAHTWRRLARGIVLYSLIIEALALGLALISTRSPDLPWDVRAFRVLPVFVVPAVAALIYTTCSRFCQMKDRRDQRTLEKLRAERQERIEELKQKSNYYLTQQLIQRYDLDPTAKAAAASVLAAKLGAESGLNLALKGLELSESSNSANKGNTRSPEGGQQAGGLRHRKTSQSQTRESFDQQGLLQALENEINGEKEREALERDAAMERARGRVGGSGSGGVGVGGGWLARIAAMLVGEDPSQCYALICKNCHMHNGLAPKEDFQYITYICPHCHTLNGSRQLKYDEQQQQQPQQNEQNKQHAQGDGGTPLPLIALPTKDVHVAANEVAANEDTSSISTTHTAQSEL